MPTRKATPRRRGSPDKPPEQVEMPIDEFAARFITPWSDLIADLRERMSGIVFVVHKPAAEWVEVWKKSGVKVKPTGTTVFGVACNDAAKAFQLDPLTRKWCATPPGSDEIKIFLIMGRGTTCLSLVRQEDGTTDITRLPDINPVLASKPS